MDNLRQFLLRVLPWPTDGNSFINIHWTFQAAGYKKPAWSGRACHTVDEALQTVAWASKMPDTKDFYVCLSAQSRCLESVGRNGRTVRKAVRSQQNAEALRSLFLDVDVKDGHHADGYDDLAGAARATLRFCVDAGLPAPTVCVRTGSGGLHVYWVLDAPLSVSVWQPLAQALAEATRRFGLKADTAVTVDSARVMRLPGTKHSRSGQMAELGPVQPTDYTVQQMTDALAPYLGARVIPLTPRGSNVITGANADLARGIESPKAAPIAIHSVADAGCGFIRGALDTAGAGYANPLWNLTTLVATFTEGGRADAHAMASGHPTYDPQETDELFDRKVREREEKDLGWPSCQSVENAGCVSCQQCPLKGPGTRPLQFGRPTPAALPATGAGVVAKGLGGVAPPALPPRYVRAPNGIVQQIIFDSKAGTSRLQDVVGCPVEDGWMQDNPYTLHFTATIGHRKKQVSITTAQANTSEGFAKEMGNFGIPLSADTSKSFREFIVAWQTQLLAVKDAVVSSAPFGWSEPNGEINGFAYGGRVWQKGTDKPASSPGAELARQFTPKGDLDVWLDAAKMITVLRTPERDAFLAASFGAPLVRLIGLRGLVIAAFSSESGAFKSTAMAVAQAVWGNPQTSAQGLDDTQNAMFGKLGQLMALPMFWDEIQSNEQAQQFVNLTFRMSGGKEKSRMASDTSIRHSGWWQTLLMSAANQSVLDYIARANKTTAAGLYRAFEYEVPIVESSQSMSSVMQQVTKLNNHFGQAGLVYAKFLGENYEQIQKDVSECYDKLEKKLVIKKEERFWVGSIAALFMGATYANRLKLTDIDLPALLRFLVATLDRMRKEVGNKPIGMIDKSAVSNTLMQFFREREQRHLLRTNKMHTGRGKPQAGSIKPLHATDQLNGLQIHIGEENKVMRIASTPFRTWAHDNGYSPSTVVSGLKREFNIEEKQGRLGSGTSFVSIQEYVLEFDLTNQALAALLEF